MNISLTPELESFVQGKVQSGMYHSASEVVREGLRLLREQDQLRDIRLAELKAQVQIGIDQLDQRQYTGHDEESLRLDIEQIKRQARLRLEQRENPTS